MNKIILLGRLTKDPEIRYSQESNIKVAHFSIAVNRRYVKAGEERKTDFFKVVTYSKLADFVEKYIKKGLQICIVGRLENRSWIDENGQTKYSTEVIAEEIDFADKVNKTPENSVNANIFGGAMPPVPTESTSDTELAGDDLPF